MNIPLAKLIPWKGSKAQLMWAIQSLMPIHYNKLVDVFGGSGCVTLNLQTPRGVLRIYNDLDSNLYNMMYCVREKPVSVITELKYMQNSREEFETMLRALKDKDFAGKNLAEELELTQISFPPAQAEEISAMLMQRAIPPDAQRAAMFFLLHNLSYNGLGTEFAALDRDWDRFEHQITRCARILQHIPMENRSYKDILGKYDAPDTVFYCDPPYLGAEKYGVPFYRSDHQELHDMLATRKSFVIVSYNKKDEIKELYHDFFIFEVDRPNSMSKKKEDRYEEYIMTNYDPSMFAPQISFFNNYDNGKKACTLVHTPQYPLKEK